LLPEGAPPPPPQAVNSKDENSANPKKLFLVIL
jgi:hypothetical protein